MATWKEKGVVPDSDDEDDLDSQSIAGCQSQAPTEHQNEFYRTDEEPEKEEEKEENGGENHRAVVCVENFASYEKPLAREGSQRGTPSSPSIGEQFGSLPSSPISLRIFRIPPVLLELEEEPRPKYSGEESVLHDQGSRPNNSLGDEDEISRSYVPLTSPQSSPLSPFPESQLTLASNTEWTNLHSSPNVQGFTELRVPSGFLESIVTHTIPETPNETSNIHRRSLRPRNLIQLHPYNLEQEKYRRTLMARGMTPMRLAHSTDELRGRVQDVASQEGDSETMLSQDMDHQAKSQSSDVESNSPSPSPRQASVQDSGEARVRNGDSVMNECDELPDLDELLLQRQHTARSPLNARLKSYSSKTTRRRLSRNLANNISLGGRENNIFEVPASPPETSSPFPVASPNARMSTSQAPSLSSQGTMPSWPDQSDLQIQQSAGPPTPATSAIKPAPDAILLESSSDGEYPFATDLSESPSSSDESVQIRVRAKEIRGVLPASHVRLDRQDQRGATHEDRTSLSLSPAKVPFRRGIARPKLRGGEQSSAVSNINSTQYPSGDKDGGEVEGDSEVNYAGFALENDSFIGFVNRSAKQRMGFAEEDNRIDAMLPSRKRRKQGNHVNPQKKRRIKLTSLVRKRTGPRIRQLNIDSQLGSEDQATPYIGNSTKRPRGHVHAPMRMYIAKNVEQNNPAPKLSILDVEDAVGRAQSELPQFLRIAMRTSKFRRDRGRHSPSKKIIKLANREDTLEAQSVLRKWREGKIRPKNLQEPPISSEKTPEPTVYQVPDIFQTKLQSSTNKQIPRSKVVQLRRDHVGVPRKLVVSAVRQRSMNDFVTTKPPVAHQTGRYVASTLGSADVPNRKLISRFGTSIARPAQLEYSEVQYAQQHHSAVFGTTKNALDSLYRRARKQQAQHDNLQLNRFLATSDAIHPSAESQPTLQVGSSGLLPTNPRANLVNQVARRKKGFPKRVDAGAAMYRQPSEPLSLETPIQTNARETGQSTKLMGLGKFGTTYPRHFNIIPLQQGIFFHESTFIGSGRLSEVLKSQERTSAEVIRPRMCFSLDDKELRWGTWDEIVSSEVGVCFDWLLDQLICRSELARSASTDLVRVITCVVGYVQTHLSFASAQDRHGFLSRISEILEQFSTKLDAHRTPVEQGHIQHRIEVMTYCTVLAMQLLQISRSHTDQPSMTSVLEDRLQNMARRCVGLLVSIGFDHIRKLYDDLQYLSVRESGIRSDRYAVLAWVAIIKILDTARIPKGSFWDVTNSHLVDTEVNSVADARVMERIWHNMFSLLPLFQFDELGVVVPDVPRTPSFDNWVVPQQMIKRVFAFCSSGALQSPSFNDYCRVTISRCHHLMVGWGWLKCSGMIGTLFDFFASQNLEPLRNEEAYKSPRFLEELDNEPSLEIEPEDRSFHIFLKIVALSIKHMGQAEDTKGIRNLVARLLPNHDRQYPKEEEITQQALASLRNHHDLLCTLFWAAPPDQQPSLGLIQELVIPDRSHNAACLINLRAWSNLARFVLTSAQTPDNFQPFLFWQSTFFAKLLEQYLEAEPEVRRQAEMLPIHARQSISDAFLRDTITTNQESTMASIRTTINAMCDAMQIGTSLVSVQQAFNTEILSKILNPSKCGTYGLEEALIGDCIFAVTRYIERVDELAPRITSPARASSTEESQESIDMENIERQIMIIPLRNSILAGFTGVVKKVLECNLYHEKEPSFMKFMILCWGRLVSLVTEDNLELKDYIVRGPKAAFERRQGSNRANIYWPLFLGELVKRKALEEFNITGFNLGLEWMLALVKPQPSLLLENSLTCQIFLKNHFLVKNHTPLVEYALLNDESAWLNQLLLKAAIDTMGQIVRNPTSLDATFTNHTSKREIQIEFSYILKEVLDSMQQHLESMLPGSIAHKDYVAIVQQIVSQFRSHASDILPLTEFFVRSSISYWQTEDDPNLFAAGIISYSLRLWDRRRKTSFELFHYLYSGWRYALLHPRFAQHLSQLSKGMKRWDFTNFILAEFAPAAIQIAFQRRGAWLLSFIYLPALASRVPKFLAQSNQEAATTFEHLVTILKIIMNGIITQHLNFGNSISGVHPSHRGILSIVCQFWLSIGRPMADYATRHPSKLPALTEVLAPLNNFASQMIQYFNGGSEEDWGMGQFDIVQGEYVDRFLASITDDIDTNWVVDSADKWVMVTIPGSSEGSGIKVDVDRIREEICTLREVLEGGLPPFLAVPIPIEPVPCDNILRRTTRFFNVLL